jgi:hydrogenase maturation protease
MEEIKKPILVLGIGNFLFKDGGVGVHVARKMMDMNLPPDVEVIDGGLREVGFIPLTEGKKKVVIVTSMKAGGTPGTIYRLFDKDYEEKTRGFFRSVEESKFILDLEAAYMMGKYPEEVVFIGIEPKDIGDHPPVNLDSTLTPIIEAKIPEIIETVMKEIPNRDT